MSILGTSTPVYYPVMIMPEPSGSDEWIVEGGLPPNPSEDDVTTHEEWIKELSSQGCTAYELPDDELPDELPVGVEDITGKIHGEPDRVFAVVCPWSIQYIGLELVPEELPNNEDPCP